MSDLKLANSATPKVLVAQQVPGTETTVYTAPAGTTVKLTRLTLVNTSASTVNNVRVSLVPTGGSGGASTRVIHDDMTAEERITDDNVGWLGPGDFISVIADTASAVAINVSGVIFSNTVAGATGVQDDATGTTGRTNATTATSTITVGSLANRYLLVPVVVSHVDWTNLADYDSFGVSSSNGGALTSLVSADSGPSGQRDGSVHFFGLANPNSGAHTLTVTLTDATIGTPEQLLISSLSFSGVGGTSGAVSYAPTATGSLSLAVTSATNNRAVCCIGGPYNCGRDFNKRVRAFNGDSPTGSGDMMLVGDAPGASTVTFTNLYTAALYAAVGIDLDAA